MLAPNRTRSGRATVIPAVKRANHSAAGQPFLPRAHAEGISYSRGQCRHAAQAVRKDGFGVVPTGPGLDVQLQPDLEKRYPYVEAQAFRHEYHPDTRSYWVGIEI